MEITTNIELGNSSRNSHIECTLDLSMPKYSKLGVDYSSKRSTLQLLTPKTQSIEFPQVFESKISNNIFRNTENEYYNLILKEELSRNVATQTDYRDSDTQTIPWEPPFQIAAGQNPEVLTITHLTWNHGLPAGVQEIVSINRMRMKRAWESILPPMDTPANMKTRISIITALEADEWAHRETEIQFVMDLRMELMKSKMKKRETEKLMKVEDRFNRLGEFLEKRKNKEINTIRRNLNRDLRRLRKKRLVNHETRPNQLRKQIKSEMFIIRDQQFLKEAEFQSCLKGTGTLTIQPDRLIHDDLKSMQLKPKSAELCVRETRWTEENLKKLHADLRAIRLKSNETEKTSNLVKCKLIVRTPSLPSTPISSNMRNNEEKLIDQYATLIQAIIKGRAIQTMMFEERDECRKLIEEMKIKNEKEAMERKLQEETARKNRFYEALNIVEETIIPTLLDFLNKEILQLEEERKAHVLALLAEREKQLKEAAEAKKREQEHNLRQEFNEIFKEIIKISRDYGKYKKVETDTSREIDESIEKYISRFPSHDYDHLETQKLEEEEMVADVIYNFVLPEVEKQNFKRKMRQKSQDYLKIAHEVIYDKIFDLPSVSPSIVSHSKGKSSESSTNTLDSIAQMSEEEMDSCIDYSETSDRTREIDPYEMSRSDYTFKDQDLVASQLSSKLVEFQSEQKYYVLPEFQEEIEKSPSSTNSDFEQI